MDTPMDRTDPRTTPYEAPDRVHDRDTGFAGRTPAGAFDPWSYRDEAGITGDDLVGYKVEATDGGIGKIDEASHEVNSSYLVVDTGPWIFGKKVMLPAGVVTRVDHADQKVFVDRSKDQIKDAPEFDHEQHGDANYRDKLGGYYGDTYGTTGGMLPPYRS
jgi:hypothetical protein